MRGHITLSTFQLCLLFFLACWLISGCMCPSNAARKCAKIYVACDFGDDLFATCWPCSMRDFGQASDAMRCDACLSGKWVRATVHSRGKAKVKVKVRVGAKFRGRVAECWPLPNFN